MTTMVEVDGYALTQDTKHNYINILLPPTDRTRSSTLDQTVKRKEALTDNEAILVLNIVRYIFQIKDLR